MKRIAVVGTSGSGKSTLAARVAEAVPAPHIQLDALYWLPNWVHVSDQEFRKRVDEATEQDRWVICGNFSGIRDIVWNKADTVIWLDYPFWMILSRLLRRSFIRAIDKKDLWGTGNRESFRQTFLSKNSIILWMLKTYGRYRREYGEFMQDPRFSHIRVVRLKSQSQADDFLSRIP